MSSREIIFKFRYELFLFLCMFFQSSICICFIPNPFIVRGIKELSKHTLMYCLVDDTDSTTNYEELQKLIIEEESLRGDCNRAKDSTEYGFHCKYIIHIEYFL